MILEPMPAVSVMKDDTLLKSERVALQGAEDFLARGDVKKTLAGGKNVLVLTAGLSVLGNVIF
jgi:hypothetical protein